MMGKLGVSLVLALLGLVVAIQADVRVANTMAAAAAAAGGHPYVFLSVPRGRSDAFVQRYAALGQVDDGEDDGQDESLNDVANDDDDDADGDADDDNFVMHDDAVDYDFNDDDGDGGDSDDSTPKRFRNGVLRRRPFTVQLVQAAANEEEQEEEDADAADMTVVDVQSIGLARAAMPRQVKSAKATQMLVARENAGAIMVPDGIIEIDGQTIIDEQTGNAALLLPRDALASIPNGSIVAVMERNLEGSARAEDDDDAIERANRVIVRRRRKGARRNVRRRNTRRNGSQSSNVRRRRRRGGNRRRGNTRKTVRRVRNGANRGGNRRRRRRPANRRNRRPALQG